MRQEIWIPRWHPTPLNKLLTNHWSEGARLKKNDKHMVSMYAREHRTAGPIGKRRVTLSIVLGKGQRKCDPDAYWKSLLDALVHAKQLINDNDAGVELGPVQFRRQREKWGSLIVLEDLP